MENAIGQRIRDRRQQLGLGLNELAERASVSTSLLSYIERGLETPSLASLARIARELRVPLAHFFLDGSSASQVTRSDRRPTLQLPGSNTSYELLTSYPGRRLACMISHLKPGTSSFDTPQCHDQEECVLVLSGTLEVTLGPDKFLLDEGDSVHFDAMVPHRFTASGDRDAVYLLVISPLVL